jgi:hypothetical protein
MAFKNIELTRNLGANYDVLIAQDVLEHLENPLAVCFELVDSVKWNGFLIFANCFHPYIEAHLPRNFYLSTSFHWIMKFYGLKFIGRLKGSDHVQIFQKIGVVNKFMVEVVNYFARALWFLKNFKRKLI